MNSFGFWTATVFKIFGGYFQLMNMTKITASWIFCTKFHCCMSQIVVCILFTRNRCILRTLKIRVLAEAISIFLTKSTHNYTQHWSLFYISILYTVGRYIFLTEFKDTVVFDIIYRAVNKYIFEKIALINQDTALTLRNYISFLQNNYLYLLIESSSSYQYIYLHELMNRSGQLLFTL